MRDANTLVARQLFRACRPGAPPPGIMAKRPSIGRSDAVAVDPALKDACLCPLYSFYLFFAHCVAALITIAAAALYCNIPPRAPSR